jgi:hypothetical protein
MGWYQSCVSRGPRELFQIGDVHASKFLDTRRLGLPSARRDQRQPIVSATGLPARSCQQPARPLKQPELSNSVPLRINRLPRLR